EYFCHVWDSSSDHYIF
nr:immunoglobulin light chain junction region [Macaca mulatta]MOW02063.1 immunoglobulin light chain junction region [Macaca mulatta]MOW02177.1 immunoglobulin light chain junction region [Macaca mulatta]MOW02439.1 immunoglobulin light chain junction region [Macaca mulatta]MOW02580.1 immunoglobulin light chain junction region [Macaca mulatta]